MKYFNSQRNLFFSSLAFLFFLQGCASSKGFVEQQKIENFSLKGKIGLIYPEPNCRGSSDCQMRNNQGGITWQQKGDDYDISVKDFFGRNVLGVSGDSRQLIATITGRAPLKATPDDFANLLIGAKSYNNVLSGFSPSDLKYWITGRVNPALPVEKNNETFSQKGFVITARNWRMTDFGNVPSLIIIKKKKFKLKLVIKDWGKIAT